MDLLGRSAADWGVVSVFTVVYLGMFLGGLPRLKLDRSGVALLGAIATIALTGQSVDAAARTVDLPTIVLLFAFMLQSAQMRLGGFYSAVLRRVGARHLDPARRDASVPRRRALRGVERLPGAEPDREQRRQQARAPH